MGVHGLWKLLEAAGKPVPLETLENKVLAVDVSIWLHQMMKGFQDSRGAPVPNAHLLGLFHRVCKLLFYRIKPVFVFDGGVPLLKKQTIAARKKQKSQASQSAAEAKEKILKNLIKRKAVRQLLHEAKVSEEVQEDVASKDDMFNLPPLPEEGLELDSDDETEHRLQVSMADSGSDSDSEPETKPSSQQMHGLKLDLHTLDVHSEEFSSLPPDVRHDILSELKETRKQNSWGRLHEMPEESGEFSTYQLGRLLKRRSVQVSLEQAEKEMGGKVMRMTELQELMEAQGVSIIDDDLMSGASQRIASDAAKRYVLCKDAPSTSQASQPSAEAEFEEDNPLFNEQAEFIAEMAENMVQQLIKKQEKTKATDIVKQQEIAADEVSHVDKSKLVSNVLQSSDSVIHADCWSSDEGDTTEMKIKINSKAAGASHQEKIIIGKSEKVALKRKMDSVESGAQTILDQNSAPKLSRRDSDEHCTSVETANPNSSSLRLPESDIPEHIFNDKTHVKQKKAEFVPKDGGECVVDVDTSTNKFISLSTQNTESIKEASDKEEKQVAEIVVLSQERSTDTIVPVISESRQTSDPVLEVFIKDHRNLPCKKTQAIDPRNSLGKRPVEIVICPGEKPDDDDIFADIFGNLPQSESESMQKGDPKFEVVQNQRDLLSKNHQAIDSRDPLDKKPLEIVISPGSKPEGDDIFADIFGPPAKSLKPLKSEIISDSEPEISFPETDAENFIVEEATMNSDSSDDLDDREETRFNPREIQTSKNDDGPSSSKSQENSSKAENIEDNSESNFAGSALLGKEMSLPPDINEFEASLEAEQLQLQKERGRQERLAASITDQMCIEAQELLQLFGLPYVVAPMEAEAQCAFLDVISLTEGSITDDSDIWLFGGKKVYKNFFNQKKHVLQFTSTNISHYFKLSREQLVQLALLVGSDYTSGIQGIGPVTALEIVAAFHGSSGTDPIQNTMKGLCHFKEWWNAGKPHKSHRLRVLDKKLKNIKFSEGFPSKAVVEAYLHPSVEDSNETFSWGALDLPALREYARSKFGWPVSKTDEILMPVSKRWAERNSQRTIESYFNVRPHLVEGLTKMSKRVQKAVTLMEEEADSDTVDDPDPIAPNTQAKKECKKMSGQKTVNKRRTQASESDSEDQLSLRTKEKDERQLPVRAPTVPRERNSTGVKRVGHKISKPVEEREGPNISHVTSTAHSGRTNANNVSSCDSESESRSESKLQSNRRGKCDKKYREEDRELPVRAPTVPRQRSSTGVKRIGVKSTKTLQIKGTGDSTHPRNVQSNNTGNKDKKNYSRVSSTAPDTQQFCEDIASLREDDHEYEAVESGTSIPESYSESRPSCSKTSDEGENVCSDLMALSGMNWEEDPWDMGEASTSHTQQRPKVFFGGVRPNKPKRPVRSVAVAPVEPQDTRGVRPGWVTRERLESRTAWVDAIHTKKEESIPQREQDHRALERAKMKAIAVVKASEARQASRLLGKPTSKRGKRRVRPTGKILPQHNLSESSSSDD